MRNKIELLAPGGDLDSIKAAILAGADAIYCGLDKFNARNRAANISFDDLQGVLRLAHQHDCQVFLTLNIIIIESEIPALINLLNKLVNTSIDAIIIQDLGLFQLLSKHFKSLKIHASTQLTTHNEGQMKFLSQMNAERVNLSRELSIHEIKSLTKTGEMHQVHTEVFVHGSNCLSFSGICYMSSVHGGNSGNRGRCSQPCRDQYTTTAAGKDFPLNLKDNSAFFDLEKLADAGVASLKIEGRIKKYDYVFTVVNTWRKQLQRFYDKAPLSKDNSDLYKVFNRDFSNAFLSGNIHQDMFIDDPRDHSIQHLSELNDFANSEDREKAALALYDEKEAIKARIENKIKAIDISKAPLSIYISGKAGEPLRIKIITADHNFEIASEINLISSSKDALNEEVILKRLKALNDTEYTIQLLDLEDLSSDVFIPFKELTSLKKRLLYILSNSRELIEAIQLPHLKQNAPLNKKAQLSVLVSSKKDLALCEIKQIDFYYELPNGMKRELQEVLTLFKENKRLIPWFPSIIIGEDYDASLEFLQQLKPKKIVTNNLGIAYEAYQRGIDWIAGPHLNMVNSYALLALKENFNCKGSFLSNEMNQQQIKSIKKPENFELYFSIYHPIVLMTTRQCLLHQVDGCHQNISEEVCIQKCEKSSTITNLKGDTFHIEKSKGKLLHIYNDKNYLNTEVLREIPSLFSSFFIDLRAIGTATRINSDNSSIIQQFLNLLNGESHAEKQIHQMIDLSTNIQYKKGV